VELIITWCVNCGDGDGMAFLCDCLQFCRDSVPLACDDSDEDDANGNAQRQAELESLRQSHRHDDSANYADRQAYSVAKRYCQQGQCGDDDEEEEEISASRRAFRLDVDFDASRDYYIRYPKIGHYNYQVKAESYQVKQTAPTSITEDASAAVSLMSTDTTTLSPRQQPLDSSEDSIVLTPRRMDNKLLEDARELFKQARLRPNNFEWREIARNLRYYIQAIHGERDLDTRIALIKEYETHKFDYDSDNAEDAEKAQVAIDIADNTRSEGYQRLYYYQVAVKFTNDIPKKNQLWQCYLAYCDKLKQ
jgi:hypothetical protein